MSHTKRYWIDDHSAIEDNDGKWVLHSDYAALVQQGIRDHQDWRSKLNFLEADYKAEIARLAAENKRLRSASFVTAVPSEEYEKLKADNERLRNYLDRIDLAINQSKDKAVDILIEWRREQGDLP